MPKGGKKANHEEDGEAARGKLAQLRPKRRIFWFIAFLVVNIWFAVVYDPCTPARKKKRTDCGWAGVSVLTCRTSACFSMPGKTDKVNLVVNVPSGQKLGLKVTKSSGAVPEVFVKEITPAGALSTHNGNQSSGSELIVRVGDQIAKINGHTGANIQAELARKKPNAKFEILRPTSAIARNVPAFLSESIVGQVLKSNGFERWFEAFSHIGGVGVFAWFLSGYPVASLPVYYLGVAGFTSWYGVKCCHDEKGAKQGDPHCFSNGVADFKTAIGLAVNQTTRKRAENMFGWMP